MLVRKSHFVKLEAAWNEEVLTLDKAIAVALDTAEKTELARLRASREASKATLDAARRAEFARVEAAWCAEIAKHDAATRAKIATLEAAKKAEIAKLAALPTPEAATKSEIALIKNRLVAMGELCGNEAPLDKISALIQETIETIAVNHDEPDVSLASR
jgi:hypothetical protein